VLKDLDTARTACRLLDAALSGRISSLSDQAREPED
jgi:hypothetical protein